MSEWREHLHLLPDHMHEAIVWWIEKAEPHPRVMGRFMHALLSNDLMESFARADFQNIRAMHQWTIFLYNYAPAPCFGSEEKIIAWYDAHHVKEVAAPAEESKVAPDLEDDIP